MTLPREFPGGVRGDGSADERSGADAARGAAGFGSEAADDRDGSAAAEARTPSGVRSGGYVAWKEERRLSQALILQYDKVSFILEPSEPARAAIGKYVTVFDYPDGRLVIRHNGSELAYRTFDKIR